MHNYDAVELTLERRFSGNWLVHRVVPLVAPARHLRGLLPRRQRPVGSRASRRSTTSRPTTRATPQIGVPQFGYRATSASSASSARARCRSIGRTSSSSSATTPSTDNLGIGVGFNGSSGQAADARWPPTRTTATAVKSRTAPRGCGHRDHRRLQEAHAVRVPARRSRRATTLRLRRSPHHAAGRRVQPVQPAPHGRLQRVRPSSSFDVLEPGLRDADLAERRGQQFQAPFALRLGARFDW